MTAREERKGLKRKGDVLGEDKTRGGIEIRVGNNGKEKRKKEWIMINHC